MLLRLRSLSERVRGSLFYVPTLYVAAAAMLAWALTTVDGRLPETLPGSALLLPASVESARSVLATIATATITVAGIVFSVTVLGVQLTASQYSPRVLRGFLRDRFSQNVIGLEVGTFAYCLLVLARTTSDPDADGRLALARDLPLTVAVVLALAAIVGIVAFIDHSARTMQVGQMMHAVARETRERVVALLPELGSAEPSASTDVPADPGHVVRAAGDGWIQQLDHGGVLRAAPPGSVARLEVRVGDFVVAGVPLVTVWPPPPDPDAVGNHVRAAMAFGVSRTMQQEVAFGLRQLVDIGLRALSPGVNDPTTALEALGHLEAILADLLCRDLPPVGVADDDRRLVRSRELDHADYVHHAFSQLRMAAAPHPAVCVAIVRGLGRLAEVVAAAGLEDRAGPLREQARLTIAGVTAGGALEADIAEVRRAARAAGFVDPRATT